MKPCCRCKSVLSLDRFYKNKLSPDGLCARCKDCDRVSRMESYRRNPARDLARHAAWKKKNPGIARALHNSWRARNRDAIREYNRNRYWANPQKRNEENRRWWSENPEKASAIALARQNKRRAALFGAAGSCSSEQFDQRRAMFGDVCSYCGAVDHAGHMDHVIPLARGGSNWPANLRWACGRCNRSKADKLLSEWKRPPKQSMRDAKEAQHV